MSIANNNMSSKETFNFRKGYKLVKPSQENIKDLTQFEKLSIGKATPFDGAIVPNKSYLSRIRNSTPGEDVACFNFVAAAFDAAANRYRQGVTDSKLNYVQTTTQTETTLDILQAVRSYQDPVVGYQQHLVKFINQFNSYISSPIIKRKIIKFEDYITEFMNYYLETVDSPPIFYKDFVTSRYNSQLTSGLVIETHSGPYEDDEYKTFFYNTNVNFEFYCKIARNFGFIIDKNIPWRWIADINSSQMKAYIYSANIRLREIPVEFLDTKTILKFFFKKPEEIITLAKILQQSYNTFAANEPTVKTFIETKCGTKDGNLETRIPGDYKAFNSSFSRQFLYFTIEMKNKFLGLGLTNKEIEIIKNKLDKILINHSFTIGVSYIDSIFSFNNYQEGSINHVFTSYKMFLSGVDSNATDLIKKDWKRFILSI